MNPLNEENYESIMNGTVLPYLKESEETGFFEGYDKAKFFFRIYKTRKEEKRGTVTILHGFTENTIKFSELSYYFLQEGFNVALYDQRGHGYSKRFTKNCEVAHVESFYEYRDDLKCFIEQVLKRLPGPHFLFSHSMGGAVAALFLETGDTFFKKAVLSSPMIAPDRKGFPLFATVLLCKAAILLKKANTKAFVFGDYVPLAPFETSYATSRARFDFYEKLKLNDLSLHLASGTYRWVLESMLVTKKLLTKNAPKNIRIPVYLFSAENDALVLRRPQEEFIGKVGDGKYELIKNARHEIYFSENNVLSFYLERLFAFFLE